MTREVALYEIPKTLEVARVLDVSVLERYNDSVASTYNSDKARSVLSQFGESKGELIGSSPFMLGHLQNSGLISGRIATRQDLETALRFNPDIFSRNYIDFGLALRTGGDSYSLNDLLAKNLAGELKQRGIKLGKGKLIPISALSLREDTNSGYGLVFVLNEDVKDFEDLTQFKWDYKVEQGLARAYLIRGGYWCSDDRDLANSVGDGRVVVVSGEATSQKFLDESVSGIKAKSTRQMEEIAERARKAENYLRTGKLE